MLMSLLCFAPLLSYALASARSVHISSKPHDLTCATVSHVRANLHISVASEDCFAASSLPTLTLEDDHELLLVTRAKVDNSVYPSVTAQEWQNELKLHLRSTVDIHQTEQMVFAAPPQIHLMQSQEDVNIYAVPSTLVPRIDMFFPSVGLCLLVDNGLFSNNSTVSRTRPLTSLLDLIPLKRR